jgi:hypothetical protein
MPSARQPDPGRRPGSGRERARDWAPSHLASSAATRKSRIYAAAAVTPLRSCPTTKAAVHPERDGHHDCRHVHSSPTAPSGSCAAAKTRVARPLATEQRANQRLHDRWVGFARSHKRAVVVNTAIARELAGWYWYLAILDE